MVKLLLYKGANITVARRHGWTVAHQAAQNRHEAVALLLVDRCGDLNCMIVVGRTPPLSYAAVNGNNNIAAVFLGRTPRNTDLRDVFGYS
jgi:ankyrin repeat protein